MQSLEMTAMTTSCALPAVHLARAAEQAVTTTARTNAAAMACMGQGMDALTHLAEKAETCEERLAFG